MQECTHQPPPHIRIMYSNWIEKRPNCTFVIFLLFESSLCVKHQATKLNKVILWYDALPLRFNSFAQTEISIENICWMWIAAGWQHNAKHICDDDELQKALNKCECAKYAKHSYNSHITQAKHTENNLQFGLFYTLVVFSISHLSLFFILLFCLLGHFSSQNNTFSRECFLFHSLFFCSVFWSQSFLFVHFFKKNSAS